MLVVDSPWAEILLLTVRILGFGLVIAACCRGVLSFLALSSLLIAMLVFFLPSVARVDITVGDLVTQGASAGGPPLVLPLITQLAVGLVIGIPAAAVLLGGRLFAHWANTLVDPRLGVSRREQQLLEQALFLLCLLSMAPFLSSFFRFFAEAFLSFPLQGREIILPTAVWQLVAAAGKMAFASAFLLLVPVFVLLLGFGFCLLLFQRLFPALLDGSGMRAILIPCLLLTLALGMYRTSLAWTDGIEQSLQPAEVKKLEQLGDTVPHGG